MNTQVQAIVVKQGQVRVVIPCPKCGMVYAVWQKPGDAVCLTCPKCGQTLTAVVPMRGG